MEKTLPDFIQIPSLLIHDENLQQLDWLVYGVVYWYSKLKLEKCVLSNQSIANLISCSKGSVANSLSRLAKHKYVECALDDNGYRKEIIALVSFSHLPLHLQMNPPSSTDEHNKNIIIKKDINTSVIGSTPPPPIAESPLLQNSKHALVPLTDLEKWEMAKEMDVPLWIVKQTDENFWRYIEEPKNKAKYKTSYRTIQTWIRFKVQKGEFKNCSETEKLQLDMQHPDKVKEAQDVFNWAREEKLVE